MITYGPRSSERLRMQCGEGKVGEAQLEIPRFDFGVCVLRAIGARTIYLQLHTGTYTCEINDQKRSRDYYFPRKSIIIC